MKELCDKCKNRDKEYNIADQENTECQSCMRNSSYLDHYDPDWKEIKKRRKNNGT
jgi:hypothetical protein